MSDSASHARYASRIIEQRTDPDAAPEVDACDDLGAFGWLRGMRERALMLELRKTSGNILAVGYAWLEKAEFNPSEGITLYLVGQKIRITGRNLNKEARPSMRLFEGIIRHRIAWVQEVGLGADVEAEAERVLIERIVW